MGQNSQVNTDVLVIGGSVIGISLGPVTGKFVAQLACGETPTINLGALQVERFG